MSSGINADYADGKKDLNDELKSEPSSSIKKMVFLLWQWAALVCFRIVGTKSKFFGVCVTLIMVLWMCVCAKCAYHTHASLLELQTE